jgi:hypothetical protein
VVREGKKALLASWNKISEAAARLNYIIPVVVGMTKNDSPNREDTV